jgi:cyclic pyranopterin phosphate synthase
MSIRSTLQQLAAPIYEKNPRIREALTLVDSNVDRIRHSVARVFPKTIKPDPRSLFISLTANCNFRCKGCHYGRDFMPGHQLSLDMVRDLLDDAKAAGFSKVRLYGGEPMLHKDLPQIVEHASRLGLDFWLTTNGFLLKRRMEELYDAGLRNVTLGHYGNGLAYDDYVGRESAFSVVEENVGWVRERFGMKVSMGLDWVLMRPTCNLVSLKDTWAFAQRYRTPIHVNLIHYSLPYFLQEDEADLQFQPYDRPNIENVVREILRLKEEDPDLLPQTVIGLRSIPDWLIKGPEMRVPCERYRLVWVGPDGTVQMCYVTFKLGNLHQNRLSELLHTPKHNQAAKDAYALNCPNCNCGYDKRVLAHAPSRKLYSVDTLG